MTDDLPGLSVHSLSFDGLFQYELSGDPLTLSGPSAVIDPGGGMIPVIGNELDAPSGFAVTSGTGVAFGPIAGSGPITISGDTDAIFTAPSTFDGPITVESPAQADEEVTGAMGTGSVTIQPGAFLAVHATLTNPTTVGGQGTALQVGSPPGALVCYDSVAGPVTLSDDTAVRLHGCQLHGTVAGQHVLTLFLSGGNLVDGANGYTGGTVLQGEDGASVIVRGGSPLGSGAVSVAAGLTLLGDGSIGAVQSSGTISPGLGRGQPATLDVQSFSSAGPLATEIDSPSRYGAVRSAGPVTLGSDSTLAVTVGYRVAPGTSFDVVRNLSGQPVVGVFKGLHEGSTFSAGRTTFRITYHGGTGNDIVLTAGSSSTTSTLSVPSTGTPLLPLLLLAFELISGGMGLSTAVVRSARGTGR